MDNGQVVEIGTHDELLQKEQGYYRDLYEAQFNQKHNKKSHFSGMMKSDSFNFKLLI